MSHSLEQETRPESRPEIGVSVEALCSIQLPDGRYLLQLDQGKLLQGKHVLTPIKGIYHLSHPGSWKQYQFQPARESAALEGSIALESVGRFADVVDQGINRESGPARVINEVLIPLLRQYGKVSSADFIPDKPQKYMEKGKGLHGHIFGKPTLSFQEVFAVKPSQKAVEAIDQAVKSSNGLVLVEEKYIKDSHPIWYHYQGKTIEASFDPACHHMLQLAPEVVLEEEKQYHKFLVKLFEKIEKPLSHLAFMFEGRGAGSEHRLTYQDIERLRLMADPNLVEILEIEIVLHRAFDLLVAKLGKGVSEGILIGAIGNQINYFLSIIGASAFALCELWETAFDKRAKRRVGLALNNVLQDLAQKYQYEARFLKLEPLTAWAQDITAPLADAEQSSPPLLEVLGPTLGINTALGAVHHDINRVLAFTGAIVVSQLFTSFLLNPRVSSQRTELREMFAHIGAVLSRYWPSILPIGYISQMQPLDFSLTSLLAGNIGGGLDEIEEIYDGTEARVELNRVLDQLTGSLATERLWRSHAAEILAREDPLLAVRWEDGARRFTLLDQAQATDRKRFSLEENLPHVVFLNYEIGQPPNRLFVKEASMSLSAGRVHELEVPSGFGLTTQLRALADKFTHPQGISLLRLLKGDINLHEYGGRQCLEYYNCDPSILPTDPFHYDDTQDVAVYLENTGIFDPDEIADYLQTGRGRDGSVRSRLKVAAGLATSAKVIFLDDIFNLRLVPMESLEEEYRARVRKQQEKVARFLAREAKRGEKIILIGTNGIDRSHRAIFEEEEAMGKIYQVRDHQYVEFTDRVDDNVWRMLRQA